MRSWNVFIVIPQWYSYLWNFNNRLVRKLLAFERMSCANSYTGRFRDVVNSRHCLVPHNWWNARRTLYRTVTKYMYVFTRHTQADDCVTFYAHLQFWICWQDIISGIMGGFLMDLFFIAVAPTEVKFILFVLAVAGVFDFIIHWQRRRDRMTRLLRSVVV